MLVVPILKLSRSHAYIEGFGVFDCCFVNHGGYTAGEDTRIYRHDCGEV